jgi:hypothetical protein
VRLVFIGTLGIARMAADTGIDLGMLAVPGCAIIINGVFTLRLVAILAGRCLRPTLSTRPHGWLEQEKASDQDDTYPYGD